MVRLSFSSDPVKVGAAREATMRCSACGKMCFASFPFYLTALKRQQVMKKVMDEHRRVCTVGNAELGRTYEVIRPRA